MANWSPETKAALHRLKTSWLRLRMINAEVRMVRSRNDYMRRVLALAEHDRMSAADDLFKARLIIAMIEAEDEHKGKTA